jgi:response regulator RpfG family c-di-GMP phosphodiesterase
MEGRAEMPHMKNLRVLIIEDDGLIALLLENVLEGMGHQVCATASTETAAVDAAHRYLPDLVIADAHLRSGSGVSAVAEKSEPAAKKCLVPERRHHRDHGAPAGCDHHKKAVPGSLPRRRDRTRARRRRRF